MPDYSNARIYKMYDKVTLEHVIGGTAVDHLPKIKYDNSKSKKPRFVDYTNVRVIEIAKAPCSSKDELKGIVNRVASGDNRKVKVGYIYKLYDNETGQYYIGSTTDNISSRMWLHLHAIETAPISSTYRIMRTWKNFDYELIDICHANYTKILEDRYIRMHYHNELNINAIPSSTKGSKDRLKRKELKADASAPLPKDVADNISRIMERRKELRKSKPFVICSYCGGSWRKGRKDHEQEHLKSPTHLAAVSLRPHVPIRVNTLDPSINATDLIRCTICLSTYGNTPSMMHIHNKTDKHTKVLKALIHHGLLDPLSAQQYESPSIEVSKGSVLCQDCGGTYSSGGHTRHNARDSHIEMASRDLSLVENNGIDPNQHCKAIIKCMVCLGSFTNSPKDLEKHRENARHRRILDLYISKGILPDPNKTDPYLSNSTNEDDYEFTNIDL